MSLNYLRSALFMVVALAGASPAGAAVCTWNGSTGNWTDASRWDCGAVPGASDDAVVNAGTVTLATNVTVRDLTFSGGTITGEGDLTITGALDWSFGTMSGSGTTVAEGATTFSSAVSKTVGRRVELAGDTTWDNGTLAMQSGAVLVNRAGQTFTDNAVGTHSIARSGTITTEPRVENDGLWVVVSGGSSTNAGFVNRGTLVVSGGGFRFIAPSVFTNTEAGTIQGVSPMDTASGAVFTNLGATYPGVMPVFNPAIFPVRGDFPMGPDHALHIDLNGAATPGTDYDQLTVEDGDVTVDGRLYLTVGYPAAVGQTFDIVAHTGTGAVIGCYAPEDIIVEPANYEVGVTCTSTGIRGTVTGVTAAEPGAAPASFALSATQPNPFSDRTAFSLTVARTQPVEVSVYDALGRRVATLFEGVVAAGEPVALAFERGALPAGAYVIRVSGEEGTLTQPVTVVR